MSGEGSVYRRKSDGRWVAALSVGSRDDRVIYRRYARSKADARALLDELRDGLRQPTGSTTVASYLERWVNDARDIRPNTRHGYRAAIVTHINPRIGHLPIGSLTAIHVEQMLADIDRSPKTARNVLVVLRRALRQAVRAGVIRENVAGPQYVDAPKVPDRDPDALTAVQVRRLLDAAKGDRLEALFTLAVALDSATFVVMGIGSELNPAVHAAGPIGALALRWTAVTVALAASYAARRYWRVLRPALLVAAYVSAFGAMSNLAVLEATR